MPRKPATNEPEAAVIAAEPDESVSGEPASTIAGGPEGRELQIMSAVDGEVTFFIVRKTGGRPMKFSCRGQDLLAGVAAALGTNLDQLGGSQSKSRMTY